MKFNITIDKKAEAAIDRKLCINCGECREICPTQAIGEYQKTVACRTKSFPEAKKQAALLACSTGCPLGIIPQAVTALVKNGDLERAYAHISGKNPMPQVCAQVCGHICQKACKRGAFVDHAINMKGLEGYVLSKSTPKPLKYMKRFPEKIAVIGGGPAGLSAAFHLAKEGYPVTIFEKDKKLGGALNWGIPAFRLDKDRMQEEIDRIVSPGIEVRYNHYIGENGTLDMLWEEGYQACLIAVGTSVGIKPDIPGADGDTVYDGVTAMRQITGGIDEGAVIGEKIVVVGGGGFAADLARVLVRMGKEVLCAAMADEADLQMSGESQAALREEGIELRCRIAPKQIITEGAKVKAVEFIRVDYMEDEQGRMRPQQARGSSYNYFCDTVIFATGRRCSVVNISKVETYPDSRIKIDECHKTNKEMIFACGDATGESSSVVEALAAGEQAAIEIDRAMRGMRMAARPHKIGHAPDGQAIYPDNIVRMKPQYEQVQREGGVLERRGPADDILSVIRSAGIEENMPRLDAFADPEEAGEEFDGFDGFAETGGLGGLPNHKVAVVGGGIAGVTAAVSLARKGYRPTIFEKYPALGGRYRWLATDKRIDKDVLIRELNKVEACGIETVYNVSAGIRPNIEQLFQMGFKAILFAIGESGGGLPKLKNADCAGVFDMVTLMGRLADNEEIPGIGTRILVAGGDEMTFDIARKLKETGGEVTVLAPLSKAALQINTSAVNAALSEGVNLVTGVEISGINEENGHICGVDCRVLEKNFPMPVPGDTLVLGSGRRPETDAIAIRNLKLDIDEDGYIATYDNLATSIPGVFSIGDFAMSSTDAGRAGATAIDNFLAGKNTYISVSKSRRRKPAVTHEVIEGDKEQNATGFAKGKILFDAAQAEMEAKRCMRCGYHKQEAAGCMGCGICVRMCPVNAITLKEV